MMWWTGASAGWGIAMMVGMLVFWALVIGGILFAMTRLGRPNDHTHETPHNAETILAERFASGQIDEQEYGSRLAALRNHSLAGR